MKKRQTGQAKRKGEQGERRRDHVSLLLFFSVQDKWKETNAVIGKEKVPEQKTGR